MSTPGSEVIRRWPNESREAAQLVIYRYDEVSDSQLIWHRPGPWKRIVARKALYRNFRRRTSTRPSPFSTLAPVDKFSPLAELDGR